jgi:hypothetical protein
MLVLVVLFGVASGGCGGSSDSVDVAVAPEPEPETEGEGYYVPMPVTQEELNDIWQNGRVDFMLDEMVLPDGSYVKDFLDVPLPWLDDDEEDDSRKARMASDEPEPVTQVQLNAFLARIQKRAWELTNRDLEDSTRNTNVSACMR